VILWDTSYGSLKKMANEYCGPQNVTEIPVSDYLNRCWDTNDDGESSSSSLSDLFERAFLDTLQQLKNDNKQIENALLILDHTTSNTAINMPLERLSKIAKEVYPNMLILVDGAHGLFAHQDLALNTQKLPHVDFYLTNGHKWLCCPRGVGFLYCPHIELRNSILRHPAVISHGINDGFQSRFLWDGCRDYAAALSVPAVLDYWEEQQQQQQQTEIIDNGAVSVRTKINNQLREAAQLLIRSWHTNNNNRDDDWERYLLVPWEHHSPMMVLVRLPDNIQSLSQSKSQSSSSSTSDDAKTIQDFLYDNFVEVPIKCIRGVLYVRISCHVYNEIHEYQRLADTILLFPTKLNE
jgi:selenocysteine lyase/cysteine desulfurase